MVKVALVTDTHFGARGNIEPFLDMTKKFFDNVMFPEIDRQQIRHLIHLGDVFDSRKHINTNVANRCYNDFIVPILERGIDGRIIIGNHDTHYKTKNSINSFTELYRNFPLVVHESAEEIIIDNTPILVVPWICQENYDASLQAIASSRAQICLGHLELAGFELFRGSMAKHGLDPKVFSNKFDLTCSGHYHHKSSSGGIHYLGSHGQFTWSDHGDRRGFHILDLQTRDLQFIENPYQMFQKVWYDDTKHRPAIDFSQFKDMYVKIIVVAKSNPYWFDMFCEHVDKAQPIGVQIVEDHLHRDAVTDDSITVTAESTLDTIISYVNNSSTHIDDVKRQHLLSVMTDLYHRAQSQVI